MRRLVVVIALVTVLLAPAAQAEAPAATRMDGLVERLMAFVERRRPSDSELSDIPFFREDLERLNPGREADVARIVSAGEACSSRIVAAMPRAARNAARALGEERLARLVEFLEGPAGEALKRLTLRPDSVPLSDAEREELDRVNATDPMDDYRRWMYSVPAHLDASDTASVTRCYEELFASAERLGLRME